MQEVSSFGYPRVMSNVETGAESHLQKLGIGHTLLRGLLIIN